MRINATFAENKCNFLALLLQQKLALVMSCGIEQRSFNALVRNLGSWATTAFSASVNKFIDCWAVTSHHSQVPHVHVASKSTDSGFGDGNWRQVDD